MRSLPAAALLGLALLGAHAQPLPLAVPALQTASTATRVPGGWSTLRDTVVIPRHELDGYGPLSLPEVLQLRAGLDFVGFGPSGRPGGLLLRGAGPSQVLVLVDGLRVGTAVSGLSVLEAIPLEMVERVEVVKGGLSGLYGSEAVGGVVQVFTRGKAVPHLFASASYGSDDDGRFSTGVATADRSTTASLSAGVRRVEVDAPFESAFATLRVSHVLWQGERITLEGFASRARASEGGLAGFGLEDRFERTLSGARITSSNTFWRGWDSHLAIGHSRDDLRAEGDARARLESRIDQASWIHEVRQHAGRLVLGAETMRRTVVPRFGFEGAGVAEDSSDTHAAFASLVQQAAGQRIEANVRREEDDQYGGHTSGSLGAAVPFGRQTELAVTWSRAFRAPALAELYLTLPGFTPNPALAPEESRGLEVALRGGPWGPVSRWSITAFETRLDHVVLPTDGTLVNGGRARVRGVEARFEARWLSFEWRGHVTAQQPRDQETGERLAHHARHFGALEVERRWGAWRAAASVVASGDRVTADGSERLGGYARVDARVTYDISKLWKVELAAVNLADERYASAPGFEGPRRGVLLTLRLDAF